jgi:hypothetical protein
MGQQNLFSEKIDNNKENTTLSIAKSKSKPLSKEQIKFNTLSKKIEMLRKKIEVDTAKFDAISNYFLKKATPAENAYYTELTLFSKALYDIYKYENLTNVNKEKAKELILSNLNDAFSYITPSDEIKAIYNALNDSTYEEEEAEQLDEMKQMMEDLFMEEFGMDVDLSDLDANPETIAKKMAELKEEFERQQEERKEKQQNRKKTKKELATELKNKQEAELQKKNIRSIYMSLAKILHPDLETDETLKLEKQELMKKVTAAYQEKDLHTLLKLEIEIIHKQSENLEHLTSEKLTFLNVTLKEQVMELEEELQQIRMNPRYQNIQEFMHYTERSAFQNIDSIASDYAKSQKEVEKDINGLTGENKKKFVTAMLKQVENPNTGMNFMGDMSPAEMMEFMKFMEGMASGPPPKRNSTKKK